MLDTQQTPKMNTAREDLRARKEGAQGEEAQLPALAALRLPRKERGSSLRWRSGASQPEIGTAGQQEAHAAALRSEYAGTGRRDDGSTGHALLMPRRSRLAARGRPSAGFPTRASTTGRPLAGWLWGCLRGWAAHGLCEPSFHTQSPCRWVCMHSSEGRTLDVWRGKGRGGKRKSASATGYAACTPTIGSYIHVCVRSIG